MQDPDPTLRLKGASLHSASQPVSVLLPRPWPGRHSAVCRFARPPVSTAGLAVALALTCGLSGAWAASTNVQFKAEASVKETYDSNVYLQDETPDAANVAAAKAAGFHPVEAKQGSFVTSILPKVGLEYKPAGFFNLSASYAPDVSIYHSTSSENYVAHRGLLNLGGTFERTSWELINTGVYIDGNTEGPTFARPDDVPAIGGIPLRDRRAAFVFRSGFRLTQTVGDWFVRPVASAYVHDFKTEQIFTPVPQRMLYSYENYIDRQDINGGVDIGYRVAEGTHVVLGYRYGQQDQFEGPYGAGGAVIDSPFDSAYHRVLVGVEGTPVNWCKVSLMIGPDFRDFSSAAHKMYPSFNPDDLLYYLDGTVTFIPSTKDTISLKATRYEQPAFSSFSVYEDIKNDLVWRHRFNERFTGALGFTLYIGDWQPPAHRNDWILTPNGSLTCAFTKKFSGELAYSYDWVDSYVSADVEPFTKGHEFTRHLATLGLKYVF